MKCDYCDKKALYTLKIKKNTSDDKIYRVCEEDKNIIVAEAKTAKWEIMFVS